MCGTSYQTEKWIRTETNTIKYLEVNCNKYSVSSVVRLVIAAVAYLFLIWRLIDRGDVPSVNSGLSLIKKKKKENDY